MHGYRDLRGTLVWVLLRIRLIPHASTNVGCSNGTKRQYSIGETFILKSIPSFIGDQCKRVAGFGTRWMATWHMNVLHSSNTIGVSKVYMTLNVSYRWSPWFESVINLHVLCIVFCKVLCDFKWWPSQHKNVLVERTFDKEEGCMQRTYLTRLQFCGREIETASRHMHCPLFNINYFRL